MAIMTLREKQSVFIYNVAKLILYAHDTLKVDLTAGELYRTDAQQDLYIKSGATKAKRSKHQDRLAIDLNLFIDEVYQTDTKAYKALSEYWKSLNAANRAGYEWGWDGNHFEME
jgi:hypothetical protein